MTDRGVAGPDDAALPDAGRSAAPRADRRPEGTPRPVTPILHVDMDAFYASVALRERPDLRDVPVAVGGAHRGVVLAASYPARAHGVRSAMPMSRARRLCPQLVVLAPDFELVGSVSRAVHECFRRITPLVEVLSADEAFLDVGGAGRRLGPPEVVAELVRATVHDEQGITCSVGVAATVSVAKLASRLAKPDGVVVVAPEDVPRMLHPLDVGLLYGVGDKTRARLQRLGLRTVGDVARTPRAALHELVGARQADHLLALAWGTDRGELVVGRAPGFGGGEPDSSMGAQHTFGRDVADRDGVLRELLRLTTSVTGRMRGRDLVGRTVAITVRSTDFTTVSRSRTLAEPTDVTREVYETAVALFDALGPQRRAVRLVGVRVEGLGPRGAVHHQHVLGERERGWSEADRAVDRATRRFGGAAVRPASLL